jgi:GNAT superfamily N-acetyltransferase
MFPRLSARTRYLRFHGPRIELTPEEVRFLTEVDGESHLAVAAIEVASGDLIGVGRFVRRGLAPQAEVAVVVADAHQGKGLGELLLSRLREAALERCVAVFTGAVLDENRPMRELLRKLGARIHIGSWGVSDIEWSLA